MPSLRSIASWEADTIRDGIAWVVIWKEGRSWHSEAMWLNPETDTLEPEDLKRAREILEKDPNAIAVNGYYCGRYWEEMRVIDVEHAIRHDYSENWHLLRGWEELQETEDDGQEDAQASGQREAMTEEPNAHENMDHTRKAQKAIHALVRCVSTIHCRGPGKICLLALGDRQELESWGSRSKEPAEVSRAA